MVSKFRDDPRPFVRMINTLSFFFSVLLFFFIIFFFSVLFFFFFFFWFFLIFYFSSYVLLPRLLQWSADLTFDFVIIGTFALWRGDGTSLFYLFFFLISFLFLYFLQPVFLFLSFLLKTVKNSRKASSFLSNKFITQVYSICDNEEGREKKN